MHGYYVGWTIVEDYELYYFYAKNMMGIMNSQLTVVFYMYLLFRPMSKIFSHLDLFKYQSVTFNLNSMNTINSVPYLVGCLFT